MDTGHGSVDQRQKRRQGMPPINKGTNASKVLASNITLFNQPAVPWASFTNCQKNGGVPYAPPRLTHRPFTEEAPE